MKPKKCVGPLDEVREMSTRIRFQKWLHQLAVDACSNAHEEPIDLPEEDFHDLVLMHMLQKLQLKYQHTYDCGSYNAWPSEMPFRKAYEIFPYCDH